MQCFNSQANEYLDSQRTLLSPSQVKAAPFGQRRPARRREAAFIQEAEASLLGGALMQWQASAEAVAASALDAHLAERRLLLAAHRRASACDKPAAPAAHAGAIAACMPSLHLTS